MSRRLAESKLIQGRVKIYPVKANTTMVGKGFKLSMILLGGVWKCFVILRLRLASDVVECLGR